EPGPEAEPRPRPEPEPGPEPEPRPRPEPEPGPEAEPRPRPRPLPEPEAEPEPEPRPLPFAAPPWASASAGISIEEAATNGARYAALLKSLRPKSRRPSPILLSISLSSFFILASCNWNTVRSEPIDVLWTLSSANTGPCEGVRFCRVPVALVVPVAAARVKA